MTAQDESVEEKLNALSGELRNMRVATIRGLSGILILLFVYLIISWAVVNTALVAEQNAIDSDARPNVFGINTYESVIFNPVNEEAIDLSGWWIPHDESRATVIWVHGIDGTRAGNMEFLASLYREGYSILMFDLRGHGESDKVPIGAGAYEHRDVLGAVALAKLKAPNMPIILGGTSLGGAIVLMTAGQDPSIKGVISDGAFANIVSLIKTETADRTPIPSWFAGMLKPGLIMMGKLFKDADVSKVAPAEYVGDIRFPIAIIHCKEAKRVPFIHGKEIFEKSPEGSVSLFVEDCEHAQAYEEDKETYKKFVFDYLETRLSP